MLLGKLLPYALVGFVALLTVLAVMIYVFGVNIRGSISLLLALSMLFMVCSLGLGLLVSTLAKTQLEAVQFAFVIMLPSVLLSGFVFPRSEMPLPIYLVTFAIPATYYIEILRGVVLRGADLIDLVPWVVGLTICGVDRPHAQRLPIPETAQCVGPDDGRGGRFSRLFPTEGWLNGTWIGEP